MKPEIIDDSEMPKDATCRSMQVVMTEESIRNRMNDKQWELYKKLRWYRKVKNTLIMYMNITYGDERMVPQERYVKYQRVFSKVMKRIRSVRREILKCG